MVLPLVDDMIQLASLLLERMPTEVEILRLKIEAERKATNQKILSFQEDLGQCHYDTKILRNEIRKRIKNMSFC